MKVYGIWIPGQLRGGWAKKPNGDLYSSDSPNILMAHLYSWHDGYGSDPATPEVREIGPDGGPVQVRDDTPKPLPDIDSTLIDLLPLGSSLSHGLRGGWKLRMPDGNEYGAYADWRNAVGMALHLQGRQLLDQKDEREGA